MHKSRARCRLTRAVRCAHSCGHTVALEDPARPVVPRLPIAGVFHEKLQCPLLPYAGTAASLSTYCLFPGYSGAGLVAFTDGSFRHDEGRGCQSGYAVVICKLTDVVDPDFDFSAEKCVVLTGTAPVSGANYTAEMQALLTTMHAIPVNVPLLCGSDALSAIQVLQKRFVSDTAALRLGARSLVLPARSLIELRSEHGCPPVWRHIESHTTKDGVLYRGNAMADKCAADACGDPRCPALTSEGAYTFWRDMSGDENRFLGQLWHISGDLRASLKSGERSALLAAWQDKTTAQGDLARSAGAAVLRLLDRVRKTREHSLFTFLVKAVTKQLATADKLFPALRRTGNTPPCPLCGKQEDHEHPLRAGTNVAISVLPLTGLRAAFGSCATGWRTLEPSAPGSFSDSRRSAPQQPSLMSDPEAAQCLPNTTHMLGRLGSSRVTSSRH